MRHSCAYEGCDTLLPGNEEHCVIHYRIAREEQQAEDHRERVRALVRSGQRRVIPLGHVVPQPGTRGHSLRRIRNYNDELAGFSRSSDASLPRNMVRDMLGQS